MNKSLLVLYEYQLASGSESDSCSSASFSSTIHFRFQFCARISLYWSRKRLYFSFRSQYYCELRILSRLILRSSTNYSPKRWILFCRTATRDFMDLKFSSAVSLSCLYCWISLSNSCSCVFFLVLTVSLNLASSCSMCFSLKDCMQRVFSSQLIFSRNSTCFSRNSFSLASFLFQTVVFSKLRYNYWIYFSRFLRSNSPLRRFYFYSSSCSLQRLHSADITSISWFFSQISAQRVSVLSWWEVSLLVRSRWVEVRLYMDLRVGLGVGEGSRIMLLLIFSRKREASSWMRLILREVTLQGLGMYWETTDYYLDRLESKDLSCSDRLRLKRFGFYSSYVACLRWVFSANKINFQLIQQLLFLYSILLLAYYPPQLECIQPSKDRPLGWEASNSVIELRGILDTCVLDWLLPSLLLIKMIYSFKSTPQVFL